VAAVAVWLQIVQAARITKPSRAPLNPPAFVMNMLHLVHGSKEGDEIEGL
jgi:hypothetical protein